MLILYSTQWPHYFEQSTKYILDILGFVHPIYFFNLAEAVRIATFISDRFFCGYHHIAYTIFCIDTYKVSNQ